MYVVLLVMPSSSLSPLHCQEDPTTSDVVAGSSRRSKGTTDQRGVASVVSL
jgi:hypothetical protein